MAGSEPKHDWLVKQIAGDPKLALVRPSTIEDTLVEIPFYNNGELYVKPDVIYTTKGMHHHHLVEVKSSHHISRYDKAMKQLERMCHWMETRGFEDKYDVRALMAVNKEYRSWHTYLDYFYVYRLGDEYGRPSDISTPKYRRVLGIDW